MSEPGELLPADEPVLLTSAIPRGCDLTASQIRRLEQRGKERRRITPKALAGRVLAVAEAYKQGDARALCGELDNLASAAMAWARYIRATKRL